MDELTVRTDTKAIIEREINRDPRLKSHHTKRGYRADLARFEEWRSGRPMTKLLVEEYAAQLQDGGMSPATVNRALAAVRWWAKRIGDLAYEDVSMNREQREEVVTQASRVAAVPDVRGEREPTGTQVTEGEMAALMRACADDPGPAGVRDAAIIALAWATGARRGEIAGLQLAEYVSAGPDEGDLTIRGKGDKERMVYIYNGAALALADWLAVRGEESGPMFCPINKGGKLKVGAGIIGDALRQMLNKRLAQAGITKTREKARKPPVTWHDFRRTFAGALLDNGADLVIVQKLMGHKSPTTTSNYDRRGEEVRRRAVKKLYIPGGYQRRSFGG